MTSQALEGAPGIFVVEHVGEKEAELLHRMFDLSDCEGFLPGGMRSLLQAPNVTEDGALALCRAVNGEHTSCAYSTFMGSRVSPGNIGLIDHSGQIEAVPEGRYCLGLQRANWLGERSLRLSEPIKQKNLTMLRVSRGKVGVATQGGTAVLLDEGVHVYNDPQFSFDRFESLNATHINHITANVCRVQRGQYARVWVVGAGGALEPKLLTEGCYVVDSALFKFVNVCDVSDQVVSHGTLHILQVPKGHVAKVSKDNVPLLMKEGTHHVESANFQFVGLASLSDAVISHGTITVVRVNRGEIGLAWQDNQPLFLEEPGTFTFDSPSFTLVRHASTNEKIIALGAKKVITVWSGEIGLSYEGGELRILPPGRHSIEDSAHLFEGFISTQQRSARLVAASGDTKAGVKDDLLICDTKDLVQVGIRADVFYAIVDPERAVRSIDKDEIEKLILETSVATLTNIIRSTALSEIAQSKVPSAVSTERHAADVQTSQAMGQASAPLFFDKAHDDFISRLHDDFHKRYGIDVTNIRIESFKIMDEELSSSISKQAMTTAQTQNQLSNLEGQTEIATREQERQAAIKKISAEADANALQTRVEAENTALVSSAEAKAKAERIAVETSAQAAANATVSKAKADGEAITIRAAAEAKAIEMKAEAEAKRARQLAETPLGAQLSLLSVYAEMSAKSNEGVEKIIYCTDPSSLMGGPYAIPSLNALNRDLQSLQQINTPVGAPQAAPAQAAPKR